MSVPENAERARETAGPAAASRTGEPYPFIFASELLGRPIVDAEGRRVGKLVDLKARLGEAFPRMCALVVRSGRRKTAALDWAEVASFGPKRIALIPGATDRFAAHEVKGEEILLKEELLDKQVVDTHGAKIERVNDIHLLVINHDLRLVHVDIGKRGILRRLGALKPVDKLTSWFFEYTMPEVLVSWKYIQPLASDPHKKDLKLNVAARRLHDLHPSDLADILEDLDRESQERVFKVLDLETAADTLQEVEPDLQRSLLESAPMEKASDLLEEMEPDEAIDLLSELPEEQKRTLIRSMEKTSRENLEDLLKFREGTAGSIMTTDYITVRDDQTIADAVAEFRKSTHPLESVAYTFVTDAEEHLVGVLTLRQLLLMDKDSPVRGLMNTELVKVETEDRIEAVAEVFSKYKFLMVPVVDEANVLWGVITFQDIIEERCRL